MTASQPNRPRRQRKGDRLLVPGATAAEIQCDYALAPFDRAARQMDETWGVDRLPELVAPETAARYGSAMAKLNAALDADDPNEVAARAGVATRGLAALDAEARRLGHSPLPPETWPFQDAHGAPCVLIRDTQQWHVAAAAFPGATIYTLREAINALAVYRDGPVAAIKKHFPEAEVTAARPKTELETELQDEIPF